MSSPIGIVFSGGKKDLPKLTKDVMFPLYNADGTMASSITADFEPSRYFAYLAALYIDDTGAFDTNGNLKTIYSTTIAGSESLSSATATSDGIKTGRTYAPGAQSTTNVDYPLSHYHSHGFRITGGIAYNGLCSAAFYYSPKTNDVDLLPIGATFFVNTQAEFDKFNNDPKYTLLVKDNVGMMYGNVDVNSNHILPQGGLIYGISDGSQYTAYYVQGFSFNGEVYRTITNSSAHNHGMSVSGGATFENKKLKLAGFRVNTPTPLESGMIFMLRGGSIPDGGTILTGYNGAFLEFTSDKTKVGEVTGSDTMTYNFTVTGGSAESVALGSHMGSFLGYAAAEGTDVLGHTDLGVSYPHDHSGAVLGDKTYAGTIQNPPKKGTGTRLVKF